MSIKKARRRVLSWSLWVFVVVLLGGVYVPGVSASAVGQSEAPAATVTWNIPPGATVEASPIIPTATGVPVKGTPVPPTSGITDPPVGLPTSTLVPGSYDPPVAPPAPPEVVSVDPTPINCGTIELPCYQSVQLPVIYEGGGGGIIGLLLAYSVVFPFVGMSWRVVAFLGVALSILLFVLSGMSGWLFGGVLFMLIITPISELLGFMRGEG